MIDKDLKELYKILDKAVAEKDLAVLSDLTKKALSEKDLSKKRAVYQYAGIYKSEIPEIKDLVDKI